MAGSPRWAPGIAELEARVAAHGQTVEVESESGAHRRRTGGHTRPGRPAPGRTASQVRNRPRCELHEPVRVALADGAAAVDQAEVIVGAVAPCPRTWIDENCAAGAGPLLAYAAEHDAKALRILGKRILEVVAPEIGEAHEARVLEQEEREAEAAAVFRMTDDGHGKAHGRFTLPAQAAMLRKALLANAAPKHRAAADGQAPVPGRPSPQRLGRRSASTSRATRPSDSPTPAASRPPSWSP